MRKVNADHEYSQLQEAEYENQVVFEIRRQQPQGGHQNEKSESRFRWKYIETAVVETALGFCSGAPVHPLLEASAQRMPDS